MKIKNKTTAVLPRSSAAHHRLGIAEIELLLSIFVLVSLMLLVAGAVNIGRARMEKNNEAAYEAWYDNTGRSSPQLAGDGNFPPIAGLDSIRPGMPNRTHVSRPNTSVSVLAGPGERLAPVTISAVAGTIGPPWSYGAYPNVNDRTTEGKWFQDYADESHTIVSDPLGLAPAFPP